MQFDTTTIGFHFLAITAVAYKQGLGLFFFTIPAPAGSGVSDWLWDFIDFGRGGRQRGLKQKLEFLQVGIRNGFLSNTYPFVVDETYLNNHKTAKARKGAIAQFARERGLVREDLGASRAAPKARTEPSASSGVEQETVNPYINSSAASADRPVENFSFGGATFTVLEGAGTGGSSSSTGVVAVPEPKVAPRPKKVNLSFRPNFSSQHCYRAFTDRVEEFEGVDLREIEDKEKVKVLFLDWHQVVDRGREGKTETLGKVPTSNLRVVANLIECAGREGKELFIGILSYIDTDWRKDGTIQYINNTTGFSTLFSFIVICRRDATGREGKSALIFDFCAQCTLSEEQILHVDDKVPVLDEINSWTPGVSVIHVKVPRKPSFSGSAAARVSYFADSQEAIEDWLRK